ncbi:MAG TPA: ribose 5-phosphate isomerase B [Vicinamibacteria bacterium]|nr:ribose 5-phosphate isomerase B [Vicinamibacteria bacterium]
MKDLVTAEDVQAVPPGGEISTSVGAVVTPWAREVAATRGVRITQGAADPQSAVIAVGADHGGFPVKEQLKAHLTRLGYRFRDLGTFSTDPVDYPDIALAVAQAVRAGEARMGILVDGAGIGSAMAANKVPGIRAALCVDGAAARNAREHNDANVLTLGAKFAEGARLLEIVETFLSARCTEERHRRRVSKIKAIEESYLK